MPLNWHRRLSDWSAHVRAQHGRVSWLNMVLALLSGPVPADVWRERIKICARCPVKSPDAWVCRRELADGRKIGCNCDLVFKCLTAVPYSKTGGCYAREITVHEGWAAYVFPSRRAKLRAVWRFIFPAKA